MAIKRILTTISDEDTLRTECEPVSKVDGKTKKLASDLLETLRGSDRPGVGIAAPQIGELKRVIVVESTGWKNEQDELVGVIPLTTLINPVINKYSEEKEERFEGCLSVPTNNGYVIRSKKIKVNALDLTGKEICVKTSGFFARVLQHEIDHLDGILFTDRIKDKTKLLSVEKITRDHETDY